MTREITAKELVTLYEGTLVDVQNEDCYGVSFELGKAKIEYDEDLEELSFSADAYTIRFSYFDGEEVIESIAYNDESEEAYIEFSEYIPPVIVRRSDAYLKYLEKELKAEE